MRGFPDLSDNNGPVDWPTAVPALHTIDPRCPVAIKATQGTWYDSTQFDQQRGGAEAHGVETVIIYFWPEAVSSGGKNQGKPVSGADNADYFLEFIGKHGGLRKNECIAVDWETEYLIGPFADLGAMQADLTGRLTRPLGVQIIEYSRDDYIQRHNLVIPTSRYWKAAPSAGTRPDCLIWQYNWHGRIPGINTEVDLNDITDVNALQPFKWGCQPDPVGGKPAIGTPDLPKGTDLRTMIKHNIALLEEMPPGAETAAANLAQYYVENYGLLGA